jgi:hypothetical protein
MKAVLPSSLVSGEMVQKLAVTGRLLPVAVSALASTVGHVA